MTDIGEESCLCPIDGGKRLGPFAFVLTGPGVGETGTDGGGDEVIKAPIEIVHRQSGTRARDHDHRGYIRCERAYRRHKRRVGGFFIGSARLGTEQASKSL